MGLEEEGGGEVGQVLLEGDLGLSFDDRKCFSFHQAGQKRKAWVSSGLSDYPKTIIVIMAILALMVIMGHALHDDCGRHGHTGLHCHH